jgi:hypothetical protein
MIAYERYYILVSSLICFTTMIAKVNENYISHLIT